MKELIRTDGKINFIDDEDYNECNEYKWSPSGSKRKYTMTSIYIGSRKSITLYLHRLIAERMELIIPEGYTIDHEDLNTFNNCRHNLRIATKSEQQWNRGLQNNNLLGVKNINYDFKRRKYLVRLIVLGICRNFGRYDTLEEAIIRRDYLVNLYRPKFGRNI